MIEIKCSVDYLAQEISYIDFLELCYKVKQKLDKDGNYPIDRFIDNIKNELIIIPIRETIFSDGMMDNIIICFENAFNPNIEFTSFTDEQLRILRVAEVIEKDSFNLTEEGLDLILNYQDKTVNKVYYNYYKIQNNIFEWYCQNI